MTKRALAEEVLKLQITQASVQTFYDHDKQPQQSSVSLLARRNPDSWGSLSPSDMYYIGKFPECNKESYVTWGSSLIFFFKHRNYINIDKAIDSNNAADVTFMQQMLTLSTKLAVKKTKAFSCNGLLLVD
ncbi:5989_t:CDS:1, partial [Paraglomus occultum]